MQGDHTLNPPVIERIKDHGSRPAVQLLFSRPSQMHLGYSPIVKADEDVVLIVSLRQNRPR